MNQHIITLFPNTINILNNEFSLKLNHLSKKALTNTGKREECDAKTLS